MGSSISTSNTPEDYQSLANKYFAQYQRSSFSKLKKDNSRWNEGYDKILSLPLEDQAKYCDYVTDKICCHSDKVILEAYNQVLNIPNGTKVNVAAIGNCSRIILELKKRNFNTEADKLTEIHKTLKLSEPLTSLF